MSDETEQEKKDNLDRRIEAVSKRLADRETELKRANREYHDRRLMRQISWVEMGGRDDQRD